MLKLIVEIKVVDSEDRVVNTAGRPHNPELARSTALQGTVLVQEMVHPSDALDRMNNVHAIMREMANLVNNKPARS